MSLIQTFPHSNANTSTFNGSIFKVKKMKHLYIFMMMSKKNVMKILESRLLFEMGLIQSFDNKKKKKNQAVDFFFSFSSVKKC